MLLVNQNITASVCNVRGHIKATLLNTLPWHQSHLLKNLNAHRKTHTKSLLDPDMQHLLCMLNTNSNLLHENQMLNDPY